MDYQVHIVLFHQGFEVRYYRCALGAPAYHECVDACPLRIGGLFRRNHDFLCPGSSGQLVHGVRASIADAPLHFCPDFLPNGVRISDPDLVINKGGRHPHRARAECLRHFGI